MAFTLLLLLQLLSVASASHYFGATTTFTYKGRNSDGTLRVDIRNRATFDGCDNSHYWSCCSGNCGSSVRNQRGVLDKSTNSPKYNNQWCESETVETRNVWSDKPFQLRAASCCWIQTRNSDHNWRLLTSVDLGTRSDTGQPNRSPDTAILPFLRVPQNCPRTYKLMSFDPDGDRVRCRYGNIYNKECYACSQPSGFHLHQDSCTLHYQNSSADPRVHGFEMVVEDFPQESITLTYTDGSQSHRAPPARRRKRYWWPNTTPETITTHPLDWYEYHPYEYHPYEYHPYEYHPYDWLEHDPQDWLRYHSITTTKTTTTTATSRTTSPETSTTHPWDWFRYHTTTTTKPTTTTATSRSTSPETSTTPPWDWFGYHTITTTEPTTTTGTSRTTSPETTTTHPWDWFGYHTTTTTATSRSTSPETSTTPPWDWFGYHTTTTTEPTTTTATSRSTSPETSTTPPWDWFEYHSTTTTKPTTTTAPLSKLPLQFSLLVDPPAPSCVEGQYLPKYVHPTPKNGERIQAEVDKEVEIRVKAQAAYATIHDMIISGPLNISTHKTTHDEFVIRWTPTSDDLGDHYPICFAVESVTGSAVTSFQTTQHHHHHHHATPSSQSGIYQSEMRCVILDVVKEQIKANVICTESTMTVEVDKSSLPGLREDHLRLTDSTNIACNISSNSTHFYAVVPLNACGTQIEEDDENLFFKNEITTVDNSNDLITRHHLLEVDFYCKYPKRGNATLAFTAHRRNVTVWEKGFGTFMYQFEFYPNNQYQTMIDPDSYPLEYDLGSRIYMQIEATSSVNSTELFVESCRAAPYDNPNYQPTYSIIENGCNVDPTVEIYSDSHETQFKFSIKAFKFIGLHDQVYISCSVLMCEAGNPNTRCSKGCMDSPWGAEHHHHHRKREAVIQSTTHLVSQGPLRLKRSAELTGSPVMNLNLNLVFVAGCLLAAVGMISAVVMYKAKMSRVKYQPLPTFES